MDRGALSSLLKLVWSTIWFLLATAGGSIARLVGLALEVALTNQGLQYLRWIGHLLSTQGHDQQPNPRATNCDAHHRQRKNEAQASRMRTGNWTEKCDRDHGLVKRRRSLVMDPLQTSHKNKRARRCKLPGWRFRLPSPGEIEGMAWEVPTLNSRSHTEKENVIEYPDQNELRSQDGARSIGMQAWRFKLPSSLEIDGDEGTDRVSCDKPGTATTPAVQNETAASGFRSRNGAKPGALRDGGILKVGSTGSRPVSSSWPGLC
ncbi:unnamed protein product [Linum trigynum]|uniref:Uncharacterized protein n=1 Tax=Linum trigynum TaxID=586398 RepID=A0AAV2FW15_9ROSI